MWKYIGKEECNEFLLSLKLFNCKDKKKYLQECGVIYYLADPRSPAKQQGLNDSEALKEAIIQYDLPKDICQIY